MEKLRANTNSRLKNYCSQKNIRLIIHDNIKENHLGAKKLHLNRKGNNVFTKNLLVFIKGGWFFFLMNEICFLKRTARIMILLFHNQMLKRFLRIFVSVIWTNCLKTSFRACNFIVKRITRSLNECNWTRAQNHLVRKRTLDKFGQMVGCLFTKWFWVRVQVQSRKLEISRLLWTRSFLTFRQL